MGSLAGTGTFAFLVRACRFFPGKFLNFFAPGDLITNYFLCGAALFRQPPGQQTFFRIFPDFAGTFSGFFKNFERKIIWIFLCSRQKFWVQACRA
jgi:hypothetical protein